MAKLPTRIVMPTAAKRGEAIEIKTLIQHVMETGFRRNDVGAIVPRDIITTLRVTYGDVEVFQADLQPGTAANPFVTFWTIATETGDLVFTWTDTVGIATIETRRLTVT